MAINVVGVEPAIGFLHDFSDYQTKESLAYDLQEPFRWLVDLSVVQAFESRGLELHDFYFMRDDYRYRFELDAKQRFIEILREQFNSGITYKGHRLKWDTVIEQKTNELSRFLTGKSLSLDFVKPTPKLERHDGRELRNKILALTSSDAKQLGIGKSTLCYLRITARNDHSFTIYGKTSRRLGLC
jgi:CRISPR-associated protein Cas1